MSGGSSYHARLAADNARREEEARQGRIAAAVKSIQDVFGDAEREKAYAAQRDAVYRMNVAEVQRQQQEAERALRFSLARSGLLGSSAEVYQKGELARAGNEGMLRAGSIADAASADLRQSDERSRQSLTSLAQSGMDVGVAQQQALSALDANRSAASSASTAASVGNLFGGLLDAWNRGRAQAAYQRGLGMGQDFGVRGTRSSYGGDTSGS